MGEANLRYARRETDDAIHICMEVIKMCRGAPEPYHTAAMIYEEKGEHERAMQVADLFHKLYCYFQFYFIIPVLVQVNCCSSKWEQRWWVDVPCWQLHWDWKLETSDRLPGQRFPSELKQLFLAHDKTLLSFLAIKQNKNSSELYWKRSELLQQEGDEKAMFEDYQKILPLIANSQPARHMSISASLTKVQMKRRNIALKFYFRIHLGFTVFLREQRPRESTCNAQDCNRPEPARGATRTLEQLAGDAHFVLAIRRCAQGRYSWVHHSCFPCHFNCDWTFRTVRSWFRTAKWSLRTTTTRSSAALSKNHSHPWMLTRNQTGKNSILRHIYNFSPS